MGGTFHEHEHIPPMHGVSRWGYVLFVAAIGVFLLLNALGVFTTLLGINTALVLAILAGYKLIYQAMLDLLDRRLSANLAIVIG